MEYVTNRRLSWWTNCVCDYVCVRVCVCVCVRFDLIDHTIQSDSKMILMAGRQQNNKIVTFSKLLRCCAEN